MAFIWSTLNIGTEITKNQITEIKNNIDTVRSDIGLYPWTWTNVPVTIGNQIENIPITEIRNALDITDNENICSSDYITYNYPVNTTELTSENTSERGNNLCGGYCGWYWVGNYTTVDLSEHITYNTPTIDCPMYHECVTHYLNNYITYQSSYLGWQFLTNRAYEYDYN